MEAGINDYKLANEMASRDEAGVVGQFQFVLKGHGFSRAIS